MKRIPYYDTTLSQEILGYDPILVRVPCKTDWPVGRWVPAARIKEARKILADQKAGKLSDRETIAAIDALQKWN
jgi:hypothetical protein